MLDSLETYLRTSNTPELHAAIEKAFEMFESYGLTDYEIGFEDILMTANNEGESEAAIRINALAERLQDKILASLQIKLAQETTLSEANTILEALKAIETTELNQEIVDICNAGDSEEETLAEVLSLVTAIDPERLVILFDYVGPSLIDRIKLIAARQVIENRTEIDVEADRKLIQRFMMYREAMDNQPLFVYDMLIAGIPLNQPYQYYHDKIMDGIAAQEATSPLAPRLRQIKTAVQICAAIVIASDTQNANMQNVVMRELEKTYTDLDVITPIYVEINSIMTKFHAVETSGIKQIEK